ncbi:MAG: hypothetical protein KatS3mg027_2360 [Bacteroidia bacterium]|nr:MAG: hypothetical protein KatS3mg027_2360 [Bacteroidia bacterium]
MNYILVTICAIKMSFIFSQCDILGEYIFSKMMEDSKVTFYQTSSNKKKYGKMKIYLNKQGDTLIDFSFGCIKEIIYHYIDKGMYDIEFKFLSKGKLSFSKKDTSLLIKKIQFVEGEKEYFFKCLDELNKPFKILKCTPKELVLLQCHICEEEKVYIKYFFNKIASQ